MIILSVAYTVVHKRNAAEQAEGVAPAALPQETARATTEPEETPVLQPARQSPRPAPAPHQESPVATAPLPVPPPPPAAGHPQLELGHLAGTLRVSLPDTPKGGTYPLEHTCYRANRSPAVSWSGVPSAAKSMVIVLERRQKDKPRAWLWAIFNLAPGSGEIPANIPKIAQLNGGARQARNVYGKPYYAGPCEPHGQVPYALRLFALNVPLGVAAGASRDDLVRGMNGHIIDAADYEFTHFFRP
jgi:Raf kinase inhibitor-like YbhB/YbcL family protein